MLEPITSEKQIKIGIGMHREYIAHKCKIQMVDNSKKVIEYIGNNKTGHLWYNYVIVNNIPEVPEDNFT